MSRQLFYQTLSLRWKGVTFSGLELFSKANLCLSRTSFQRLLESFTDSTYQESLNTVRTKGIVLWGDNYSKSYSRAYIAAGKATTVVANYSVIGYRNALVGDVTRLHFNVSPNPFSAQSSDMFDQHNWRRVVRLDVRPVVTGLTLNNRLFATASSSVVRNFTLSTPQTRLPDGRSVNGVDDFVGLKIIDHNVSSDVGLMELLKEIGALAVKKKYTLLKMDENLYKRVMKVRKIYVNAFLHMTSCQISGYFSALICLIHFRC